MKVLLFTGAGFSHPLGLPITTGFSSQIDGISKDLKYFLKLYLKDSFSDIEKVLSTLDEFSNQDSFLKSIINDRSDKNPSSEYPKVLSELNSFKTQASASVTNIKRSLYTILNKFNEKKAFNLYKLLFLELKENFPELALSFFTTNYDLTFEKFIYNESEFLQTALNVENVEFGFANKFGANVFDAQIRFDWEKNIIEYQKLHGSLDWIRDGNMCVKSGVSLSPAMPNETPILYPGYKDNPSSDPFITVHHNLSQKLSSADIVIVVGFAFRDKYLNTVFESYLRTSKDDKKLLCFNPCKSEDFPNDSMIPHFANKYTNFVHIEKGIEIKDSPLDLKNYLH